MLAGAMTRRKVGPGQAVGRLGPVQHLYRYSQPATPSLVPCAGIEPATFHFSGGRSFQLS
jgi:hypothetical protein